MLKNILVCVLCACVPTQHRVSVDHGHVEALHAQHATHLQELTRQQQAAEETLNKRLAEVCLWVGAG